MPADLVSGCDVSTVQAPNEHLYMEALARAENAVAQAGLDSVSLMPIDIVDLDVHRDERQLIGQALVVSGTTGINRRRWLSFTGRRAARSPSALGHELAVHPSG
jgi:hypothetical protein